MDRDGLKRLGQHIVSRRVAPGFRYRTDFAASLRHETWGDWDSPDSWGDRDGLDSGGDRRQEG